MQSFMFLLLFSLLPSTTPSSVHRRLDRHTSNEFDEIDSLNPPTTTLPTNSPIASPTNSPIASPTNSPIASPTANIFESDDEIVCSSNADGSFGKTVGDLEEIIISYRYEMDTGENIVGNSVLKDLEAEITDVLIRSANPDCSGPTTGNPNAFSQTGIVISGISAAPDDNSSGTSCLEQSGENDTCYDVAGQLSLFVDRTRRFLSDSQNIDAATQLLIKGAMNSGELTEKITGITRLEWVDGVEVSDFGIKEVPPSDVSISVRIDDENLDNIGYALLTASGVLLLGGYGMHILQKRRKRNISAQQSESDEGFDQIT